jgi:hypothetical protein
MDISRPYLSIPLNAANCKTACYITVNALKQPTLYPYFDTSSSGRSNLARIHYERMRAIQQIKVIYANETQYDFNDTMEMIDAMYMDVYKEQMSYLTYWYQKELLKSPADTALNKISSYRLMDYIDPTSNLPASYATQNGTYLYTHSTGTQFYFEIFRGKCVDIKARTTSFTFPSTSYNFSIPKSSLGGAVAGQNSILYFTSYYISNTLQSILNEMKHYNDLMYKLAVRRLRRYGGVSVFDFSYYNNPNGGLKYACVSDYEDPLTMEKTAKFNVNVNLDLNDFYITPSTGEIALNLTNKIDTTLVYNTSTRNIGVNLSGAQTFGNIICGTIGCGAITSSGAFTCGNNSLTSGTISSTSINTNNNNITMGTGDLSCDIITCGIVTCGGDINGNGAGGYWKLTRPDTWIRLKDAGSNHLDFAAGKLYAHSTLSI